MAYVGGFLIPVRENRKDEYFKVARDSSTMFKECGALRQVECWGDVLQYGEQIDL